MRLLAIRGYAAHATEEEVNILVYRLLEILKKWYEKNPDCYAYKDYNLLRSDFMIKYLLKKYKKIIPTKMVVGIIYYIARVTLLERKHLVQM